MAEDEESIRRLIMDHTGKELNISQFPKKDSMPEELLEGFRLYKFLYEHEKKQAQEKFNLMKHKYK